MNRTLQRSAAGVARRQAGLSVVELMIGMGIGLMVTMAIAYVLVNAENQRRSSSTGADAQINGGLAVYAIERQLKMAGYGLTNDRKSVGCVLQARFAGAAVAGAPPVLAPVIITPGADDQSDTVRVLASNARGYAVEIAMTANAYDPTPGSGRTTAIATPTTFGIQPGDLLALVKPTISNPSQCQVFQATGLQANQFIQRADDAQWNEQGFPNLPSCTDGYLLNLGSLSDNTFTVTADRNLRLTNFNLGSRAVTTQDVQSNIVLMKAYYGRDLNLNGIVDTFNTTMPVTREDWETVLAVRVAVVARSAQYEKEKVTKANPSWDVGSAATVAGALPCGGGSQCVEMKVSSLPDWEHYRYRIYETLVPLRNQVWRSEDVPRPAPGNPPASGVVQ